MMRIKRFEAPDNQTALRMVKKEMGEDALILATRTLAPPERRGNIRVEVVAAVDYDTGPESPAAENSAMQEHTYDYSVVRNGANVQSKIPGEILAKDFQTTPSFDSRPVHNQAAIQDTSASGTDEQHSGFLNFRKKKTAYPSPVPEQTLPQQSIARLETGPSKPNPADVARWRDQLINQITIRPPQVNGQSHTPAIIALVGATGVGKTTTAAKMAAWYTLREGLKVTLISMDCYRIGATDQLRTYAKIMRLPCEIALRRNELAKAIDRHRSQDVIIIDTAGTSPYNNDHISELGEWFAADNLLQPYLLVSATTKKEDMAHTIEAYRSLSLSGIMVTKLDETRAYATLCQQLAASHLPVSALSMGQKVPEDFMMASRDFLETLFREGWNAATTDVGAA